MTSQDSSDAADGSQQHAVFSDNQDEILTAAWMEAAVFSENRTQTELVDTDDTDQ